MNFDDPDVLRALEECSSVVLAGAPFGVVQMRLDGTVEGYNSYESKLSGLSPEKVLGKKFFIDVAPCTNNYMVAQRFVDAESLDEYVDYVFTYKMKPTPVRLRLLRTPGAKSMVLLVQLRPNAV